MTVLDWDFAPSTFTDENGAKPDTPTGSYQAAGGFQQNGYNGYNPQQGGFAQNPAPAQNNYTLQGAIPQNDQQATGGYQTPPTAKRLYDGPLSFAPLFIQDHIWYFE